MFDDVRPIDLTLLIDERLPCTFPPHVPFVRRTWNWFADEDHGPEAWVPRTTARPSTSRASVGA